MHELIKGSALVAFAAIQLTRYDASSAFSLSLHLVEIKLIVLFFYSVILCLKSHQTC
jgi:hypothetical protein